MQLTKHHGLGNDFLVLLDAADAQPVSADFVRAICDRHRGVGADGFIRATAGGPGADITMHLYNADGSRAEMSGNGVSSLAQAVTLAGHGSNSVVAVTTDAGLRSVVVRSSSAPHTHEMTVAMGNAVLGEETPEWLDDQITRAVPVDMGNPHLVLHVPDPDGDIDIVAKGREIDESTPGGVNVEAISPTAAADELRMTVYERGAGRTEACGTGACAAAAAARSWGLCGDQVRIAMPGGTASVQMGETILMTVPIVYVASIDYPWP